MITDYTSVDLSVYTTDELNAMLDEENHLSVIANTNQLNRKILINSLYGASGSEHFRYFSIANAEATTSFGQVAIKWVAKHVNIYLNKVNKTTDKDYVIYTDTDSIYVDFEDLVNKVNLRANKSDQELVDLFDKICEGVCKNVIDPCYAELQTFMNNDHNHMKMDREVISIEGGFFNAKKRYALSVDDNEGERFNPPKLKLTGIETQRSSTPPAVTVALTKAIRALISEGENELQKIVSDFEKEWKTLPIDQIASASSANNISVHLDKNLKPKLGAPGHIRAAGAYNRFIMEKGLHIDPIADGEKINIITLNKQNPFGAKSFAWPAGLEIPHEFGNIESVIDRHQMFDDKFIAPLLKICDTIESMNPVKSDSLDAFF